MKRRVDRMMKNPLGFLVALLFVCGATTGAQTPAVRRPATRAPKAAAPPAVAAMVNADVIKMVHGGVNESVIIATIQQFEKRDFSLGADSLVELKTIGVSDNIVHVMLDPSVVLPTPAVPCVAVEAKPAQPAPLTGPTLPASTVIAVRTIDLIKSAGAASSLEYKATVDDSVIVGGTTVAPVGTPAFLRIVQVQQAGAVNGRASLSLKLIGLEINGQRIAVETGDASIASGSQAARATKSGVGGAIVGGILGGLLGGKAGAAKGMAAGAAIGVSAAVMAGQTVSVPSETRLSFTLSSASVVSDPSASAAPADAELLEKLLALERQGTDLAKAGDRSSIDAMLDPGYTLLQDGRRLSRSQVLSSMKPQPDIISNTIDSPVVHLEGEQAVLTGYYVTQIRQRSQPKVVKQKFRDVFVQRDGRWLLLASETVNQ